MLIPYRKEHPKTSKTWFAKMRVKDRERLEKELIEFLLYFTEKSLNPLVEPWLSIVESSRKHWGYSEYEKHANNMLSVLGGIIKKLRKGADLTEKQLVWATKIGLLMPELGDETNKFPKIEFEHVEQFASTGNAITDLQNKLFEGLK